PHHPTARAGGPPNAASVPSPSGSYRAHRPTPASRKVGIPLSCDMPAPVATTTRGAARRARAAAWMAAPSVFNMGTPHLPDDANLPLLEPAPESLEHMHGPRDARCRQPFDRPGGEPPLELAHSQQHLEALAGERHPHAPIVLRVRRGLDEPLQLEPLDDRGGGGARHAKGGGAVLGPGDVGTAPVHGIEWRVGAVRLTVGEESQLS